MSYPTLPQSIPQDQRAGVNENILFGIDTGNSAITPEAVYNCYTGIGGLHNLRREDYRNYHEYAQAKKELEMGQFFTPHLLCRDMVGLLSPGPSDMVLDMCCGIANFFNWLPNPHNAYGFDVDGNAVNVARYLYPEAHVEKCDIVQYHPDQRFDAVIGNPPFNLKIDGRLSQFYYMAKAHEVLNPAGFLMMIVPHSFLSSEFWERSRVEAVNCDFSFVGQTRLPPDAFAAVGVENFETKIMVFLREYRHIESTPYDAGEFLSWEELRSRIEAARQIREKVRISLTRERNSMEREELESFEYKTAKYLYELKTHRHLQKHYNKAAALITKFRNQKPPDNCTNQQYKEWERSKLTTKEVLSVLGRYIRNQYVVPRKEIALVRTNWGYKLKGYAPRLLDKIERRSALMYDLVLGNTSLPVPELITPALRRQVRAAEKVIRRKRREYEIQSREFRDMQPDPALAHYLDKATFINKEGQVCRFTELQKSDLNLILQKRYSLLNWQQGSGKTAAVYHYAKYQMLHGQARNTFVLAPAITTNLTWETFLRMNGERYMIISKFRDFDRIPEGVYVVVSISMLDKFKRHLYKLMKARSQKACLIFDESDEITNPNAVRTQATLGAFRQLRHKVLATGTTTRNNINEIYPRLELLYNNSINMMCRCETVYRQNPEGEIEGEGNRYYGMPLPAYRGHILFKECFCPGKVSVFGIEKQNQDIYNKDHLSTLVAKTGKRLFPPVFKWLGTHTVR